MYIYKIELMPGYKATSASDTSGKYQIRRYRADTSVKDKKHREIIRTNLDYDEAMAQIKIFNDKEGASRRVNEPERETGNEDEVKETPLFLRDSPEGVKGDAQDEKDEMGE
jgi:hypothetical protein